MIPEDKSKIQSLVSDLNGLKSRNPEESKKCSGRNRSNKADSARSAFSIFPGARGRKKLPCVTRKERNS
jgi:hypothetical protein